METSHPKESVDAPSQASQTVDAAPHLAGYFHSASPGFTVVPQPPWWQQIWSTARRFGSAPVAPLNSDIQARAQNELQRDLTGLVLAAVARCTGLDHTELQGSATLHEWIGQHLQPLTHHTPEWVQFVAFVGTKKLNRHFGLDTLPLQLDPSHDTPIDMETLPVESVVTTTPESNPEQSTTTTKEPEEEQMGQPNHSVDPPVVEPHVPHVAFAATEEDPSVITPPKKRKRTSTPRLPRTIDLPPVATKKPKKEPKPVAVKKEPKPRAPRAPKKTKTVPDPSPIKEEEDTLLALPEIVVP